jgi:hypothetical protein
MNDARFAMTLAAAAAAVLLIGAGCGGGGTPPRTQLTMLAINPSVGRAVFHLDCDPAGGDLTDPAGACVALAKQPRLLTDPQPFTCAGGTFSWWDVTITGRLNGRPLRRSFSTCWTPQMATLGRLRMDWKSLQKHLLPRRTETLLPGTERTFPAGALRPADLVTCTILGHHLGVGVPETSGPDSGVSNGYGGANVISVTLAVERNRDGSVSATCHRGNS